MFFFRFCLLFVCLMLLCGIVLAEGTLSMRADVYYPYNGNPAAAKPGYMIEVAKAVFEKLGTKIDYQTEGWTYARSIEEVQKGNIDGLVCATRADAPDLVYPDEPQAMGKIAFVVLKSSTWKYTGLASLKNLSVGVIESYSYEPEFDKYVEANKANEDLVQISSDNNALESNLKKLKAGRLGAVVDDPAVLLAKSADLGMSNEVVIAGYLPKEIPLYIAFSPAKLESKQHAEALSEGMKQLRASGELAKILAKYGLEDWKK